jgi:hypothetical protein
VLGGVNRELDALPIEELTELLKGIAVITVFNGEERICAIGVRGFKVTTAIWGGRNVFLLLDTEVDSSCIQIGNSVYVE